MRQLPVYLAAILWMCAISLAAFASDKPKVEVKELPPLNEGQDTAPVGQRPVDAVAPLSLEPENSPPAGASPSIDITPADNAADASHREPEAGAAVPSPAGETSAPNPAASPAPIEDDEGNFPVNESDDSAAEPGVEPQNKVAEPAPLPETAPELDVPTGAPAVKTPTSEAAPVQQETSKPSAENAANLAVLQGLNKITARISTLEVPIGSSVRFGNLEVVPRLCWRSSPEEAPDSKALLEIWEQKPGEGRVQLFNGWMFASSPALSALEHPVYDVTVTQCKRVAGNIPAAKQP